MANGLGDNYGRRQRMELMQTYPENTPDTPTWRRGYRFGRSAPTRANGTRVVRWLGHRGPSLPINGVGSSRGY
jgi:hypothetical protein